MTIPAIHTKILTSVTVVAEIKVCIGMPTSATGIRKGKHTPVGNARIVHLHPFRLPELERHIHRVINVIGLPRLPASTWIYWT